MSIKYGDIEFTQILDNEFRIGVLESVIDLLISKNPALTAFTKEDLDLINFRVTERLQKKYPNSGIQLNLKGNENKVNNTNNE